jgi:hypothetical protein
MPQHECPKCQGRMAQGFVPDWTYGAICAQEWHQGRPKKSLLTKTKRPRGAGRPIGAYRCTKCGYLEFYAGHEYAPE